MSYKVALENAWQELSKFGKEKRLKIKFLADEYDVDLNSKRVLSLACNIPPHEHIAVLILHYALQKLNGLPQTTDRWISFQELQGGQGYYDAFKKRAIAPLIRKYGDNPQELINCLEKMPGKRAQHGDTGVVLEAFENVPVLVTVWGKDEEFSADANIHFDDSISKIFCTEDIAVLADIISRQV